MNSNGLVRVMALLAVVCMASAAIEFGNVISIPLPQQPQGLFWYAGQLHVSVGLLDARNVSAQASLLRLNTDGSVNASLTLPIECLRTSCVLDVSHFVLEGDVVYFNAIGNDATMKSPHWSLVSVDLVRWEVLATYNSTANDAQSFRLLPFNATRVLLFDRYWSFKGEQGRLTPFELPITPASMGVAQNIELNDVQNGALVDNNRLFACDFTTSVHPYGLGVLDASSLQLQQWAPTDCLYSTYVAQTKMLVVAPSRYRESQLYVVDTTRNLPSSFNASTICRLGPTTGIAANAQYAFVVATDFYIRWSKLVQVDISQPSHPKVVASVHFPQPWVHQNGKLQSMISYTVNDATKQVVGVVQNKATLVFGILFVNFS